jgi:hypothetical protein
MRGQLFALDVIITYHYDVTYRRNIMVVLLFVLVCE